MVSVKPLIKMLQYSVKGKLKIKEGSFLPPHTKPLAPFLPGPFLHPDLTHV